MLNKIIRPPINKDYYENLLKTYLVKYGGACWPLDDWNYTSGANAGVARELMGKYPGAISGTTYYNQVTVTGTLNPDATGTYTVAGIYNGYPYWRRGSDNYFIWWNTAWRMTSVLGATSPLGSYWGTGTTLIGAWYSNGFGTYTGHVTVANVTASGIYLFVPSGVTLQSAGPVLAGSSCRAAAFDGVAGKIDCGNTVNPTGNFTLSVWMNSISNSWTGILTKHSSPGNPISAGTGWQLANYNSTRIAFYSRDSIGGGASNVLESGLTKPSGWFHFAVSKSTNLTTAYINGVFAKSTNRATADCSNTTTIKIAKDYGYFAGSLAYPMVITAALSAAEITALYKANPA